MKDRKHAGERGRRAEKIAANYLSKQGYRIIERNFACKLGEIDIIARHEGDLVFVEVRSRHSASAVNPAYSVDRHKQRKIVRSAEVYLDKHFDRTPPSRFDVVLVTF
ncbi:MAG: YraN family protein, partial [Deltaproteobacteria bacterium]